MTVASTLCEVPNTLAAIGMPEPAQRFGFDLAYPLTRDTESLAHLFECVAFPILEAESEADDLRLARLQRFQELGHFLFQLGL